MNTLHYSSIYDMRDVAEMIMNKTPDVVKVRDSFGFTPLDYAYALGKTYLMNLFVSKNNVGISPSKELLFESFGWLRRLLETNEEKEKNTNFPDYTQTVPIDKGLCLEGMLLRSDDHAAAMFIESSRYMLEIRMNENAHAYGKLIHLSVRFGCLNSLCALLKLLNQDVLQKILTMTYENMIPIAWAVKMASLNCLRSILDFDKDKISSFWRAPITEENLLHVAVKTGHLETVKLIDKWTEGLLRTEPDQSGLTPIACACALGFHYLLSSLCGEEIKVDSHSQHHGRNLEFTCVECLLDLGIGWSKNLQNNTFWTNESVFLGITRPVKRVRSSRGIAKVREFQFHGKSLWINDGDRKTDWLKCLRGKRVGKSFKKYIEKTRHVHAMIPMLEWCRFNLENSFIAAFMFSMGYSSDRFSVMQLIFSLQQQRSTTCPALKMLRLRLQANQMLSMEDLDTDKAISFFEIAAASGDKAFFDSNTERFNALSSSINETLTNDNKRLSLSEIAYGFGHYEVGKYLDDELTRFGIHGIHRNLHDMRAILPQKVLWALRFELPGDDSWQIEKEIVKRSCRLTKADIWLTTTYPSKVVQDIEQDVVSEALIPVKCANKKFNPDVDGFGKQSCFIGQSNIWIRCLVASSMVYGHTYEILKMDETKYMAVTSIRIACIPAGTGDHAKTVIEQNGTYIESIGLHVAQDSVVLQNDSSQYTRFTEARLRDSIQHQAIPQIQQMLIGFKINQIEFWKTHSLPLIKIFDTPLTLKNVKYVIIFLKVDNS
ncbi:hypothetical protein KUTeg_015911 [Tegillarca granosa]|uniref:Uncharacterized protein n=1 Tax=Tegillarca granosa TaxID=220873 RepID=A0ABQ9EN98_TEGGR|nr:hypothetical protein KUTeg_015911 [Tegillarca granosa]